MKKVLNVGGNSKAIPLPPQYAEFEHVLLDIDPTGMPDIVCDARKLTTLDSQQFDAVYCSHNLEHYYHHDVAKVLAGFLHVLKNGGVAHIRVPDIGEVMRVSVEKNLDIEDVLYQSSLGPIMVMDVIYGYTVQIEQSGQDFFAHKTGFTQKSLLKALTLAGFTHLFRILGEAQSLEINVLAFKGEPDIYFREMFGLPKA
jgi:SAM-dependent methyltransferase